ncbi:MAG: hypothetical protein H6555_09830 [Lewinellaceae bacterium]|nr:hypothetical protein [Lewinellaceae bacterium]
MTILRNWSLTRILQVSFGTFLIGSFLLHGDDVSSLAFGGLLLLMGLLNIGCPLGACAVPIKRPNSQEKPASTTEVEYDIVAPNAHH